MALALLRANLESRDPIRTWRRARPIGPSDRRQTDGPPRGGRARKAIAGRVGAGRLLAVECDGPAASAGTAPLGGCDRSLRRAGRGSAQSLCRHCDGARRQPAEAEGSRERGRRGVCASRLNEQSGDGWRDCCSVTDGAIRQPGGGLPLLVQGSRLRRGHERGSLRPTAQGARLPSRLCLVRRGSARRLRGGAHRSDDIGTRALSAASRSRTRTCSVSR
jgi:hypothetical protein